MDKKKSLLEKALLKKIKNGQGSVMDILSLTNEYNVSISDVRETLKTLINRNQVIKSGEKYVIKNKT